VSDRPADDAAGDRALDEAEEVDAVPVLAGDRSLQAARAPGQVVVRQAAAVAATSFAAGLATVVVGKAVKNSRARRRARRSLPVVATRSFLVDVHLLGSRE